MKNGKNSRLWTFPRRAIYKAPGKGVQYCERTWCVDGQNLPRSPIVPRPQALECPSDGHSVSLNGCAASVAFGEYEVTITNENNLKLLSGELADLRRSDLGSNHRMDIRNFVQLYVCYSSTPGSHKFIIDTRVYI
jgi:hypothetical protein